MKLYIWNKPYPVSWGSSLLFAVAASLEEAKKIAVGAPAYSYGIYENGEQSADLGEPTRVLDLPCAEWHQWSE